MNPCPHCGGAILGPGPHGYGGQICQCWNDNHFRPPVNSSPVRGCVCPPGSEMTCRGVGCPRGGGMPLNPTSQTSA